GERTFADGDGPGGRHAGVHAAGAGPGKTGPDGAGQRRVRPGSDAVRFADGPAALCRPGRAGPGAAGGGGAGAAAESVGAGAAGGGVPEGDGEEAGRPLPDGAGGGGGGAALAGW